MLEETSMYLASFLEDSSKLKHQGVTAMEIYAQPSWFARKIQGLL